MDITLAKALVVKKELVNKLQELIKRFKNNFSSKEGTPKDYQPGEVLQEIDDVRKKLIEVKCKIQQANMPIEQDILELGELKLLCKTLQEIKIVASVREQTYIDGKMVYVDVPMDNFYSTPEKDQQVASMRKTIISIQNKLNEFNYNTKIQLSFEM